MCTVCVGCLSSIRCRITSQLYAPGTYSGCILTPRVHCHSSLLEMQGTVGAQVSEAGHQAEQSRYWDCEESYGKYLLQVLIAVSMHANYTHAYTHLHTECMHILTPCFSYLAGSRDRPLCFPHCLY